MTLAQLRLLCIMLLRVNQAILELFLQQLLFRSLFLRKSLSLGFLLHDLLLFLVGFRSSKAFSLLPMPTSPIRFRPGVESVNSAFWKAANRLSPLTFTAGKQTVATKPAQGSAEGVSHSA
ncbi:hypothetical protein BDV26DRAFT_134774 [Aspergillus bertholletiae]|uniref:Uncharacterized protein n=1 Tax=Aspergillus bertholletiae TaxID=1226010 RepID=A0A5N7AQY3_9EURO|nr:hypothetical protein BDV26DRAFT_134774 [Aspergillus bertholletiae]